MITWVADHRRHHAFADKEGDPHSPWRYGNTPAALAKGFATPTSAGCSAATAPTPPASPPTCSPTATSRGSPAVPAVTVVSLLAPALLGGLVTMSWWGALTAFFWAGLVRVAVLHHVTWSINSICHMIGERPFATRDKATNVWPLAILSMGESWHNLHHADPTCARHGVRPGQLDMPPASSGSSEARLGARCPLAHPRPTRQPRRLRPAVLTREESVTPDVLLVYRAAQWTGQGAR